ncbi:FHA domain-containing protein [Silanimonas sp.]|uniref:FHA domain-containing protein n=1 Tax=Silanimonas sp. TaxID=1929290 RepID=UPI001BBD009C|nr:FHA domain-containing protein [Silanimonas sp.]MBS3896697.1 FHA domain-containing protein [Silanimonas sp.]
MRLTFPNGEHAAVLVEHGQVGVGSAPGGGTSVAVPGLAPLHAVFASGRRGYWLTVPAGARVVLNARPVQRLAWLRPGDLVCLDTVQIRIESDTPPPAPGMARGPLQASPLRQGLRGLNGNWFGHCRPLSGGPLLLGSGSACDLRFDAPGVLDRHAVLEPIEGGGWLLRRLAGTGLLRVNGHALSEVELSAGDQIELGEQRLLLESPGLPPPARSERAAPPPSSSEPEAEPVPVPRDLGGIYLLIAAAAALAAALTAFFVYAPRG